MVSRLAWSELTESKLCNENPQFFWGFFIEGFVN